MRTIELELADEGATRELGATLAEWVEPGVTIALIGELGSGKTTFTRGLAEALGVDESKVSSPTYVLHQIYPTRLGWLIHHFDVYRLEDSDQFEALGVGEIFDSGGVSVVEWADKAMQSLPENAWRIELKHCDAGKSRTARLTLPAEVAERLSFFGEGLRHL